MLTATNNSDAGLHRVQTADGATIVLHHVAGSDRARRPVVLGHGTFSNAHTCMLLAKYPPRARYVSS
ncbi:MAG: hypothetical protein AAF721_32170 [Myxococcota bacterium]